MRHGTNAPPYDVLRADLSVARQRVKILETGVGYDTVVVVELPSAAAAGVELHMAPAGAGIPLLTQGQAFELVDEYGHSDPATEGLYLTTPGGAVGTLRLYVAFRQPPPGRR